jgi:hypothetical protein
MGNVVAENVTRVGGDEENGTIATTWGPQVIVDSSHAADLPNGFVVYAQQLTWSTANMKKPETTYILCVKTNINIAKP